jgi:hypothetical protein
MKLKEHVNKYGKELDSALRWRDKLPPDLAARATSVYTMLGGQLRKSLDAWVDGFCFDMHPEREIALWERYAALYHKHSVGRSTADKRTVFIIMMECMGDTEVVDLAEIPGAAGIIRSAHAEATATGIPVDIAALDAKVEVAKAAHTAKLNKVRVLDEKICGMGKTFARMWRILKDDIGRLGNN